MREWTRQLRAVGALLRVSLATAMQYRSNFLFQMVVGLLRDVGRVAPLALVFWHRDTVGGWELPHALLVMAFFLFLTGIQSGVFEPNLGEAVESIRHGTLDLMLMKPVDGQLLVSLRKVGFVSSAGLRILLATAKRLTGADSSLKISDLNETVHEVFEISGFITILSVYKTEEEALQDA